MGAKTIKTENPRAELTDETPFHVGALSGHRGEYATLAQFPTPTTVRFTSYGQTPRGRGMGLRAQIGESGQYVSLNILSRANMRDAGVRSMGDILGDWLIGPSPDGKTLAVLGKPATPATLASKKVPKKE